MATYIYSRHYNRGYTDETHNFWSYLIHSIPDIHIIESSIGGNIRFSATDKALKQLQFLIDCDMGRLIVAPDVRKNVYYYTATAFDDETFSYSLQGTEKQVYDFLAATLPENSNVDDVYTICEMNLCDVLEDFYWPDKYYYMGEQYMVDNLNNEFAVL